MGDGKDTKMDELLLSEGSAFSRSMDLLNSFGFSASIIIGSLIFSVIGYYFIKQGKKHGHIPTIITGAALWIYPYFIRNDYLFWGIGIGFTLLGYRLLKAAN